MYEIKRAERRSQAPVHLVTDRASLFTDQRMSGVPLRARCKTIGEHAFQQVSNSFKFLFLDVVIIQART